jgi:signal transduction histidine kinase
MDAHAAEAVLGYLQDDGLDVDPYLARGQLVLLTGGGAYRREGVFDPEGMVALLRAETERALAEGYAALRVAGEMTWVLRGLAGSAQLIEYEAKLSEFFPGSQCLALCLYDRQRFEPAVLLDVLRTHPVAVVDLGVYDNFYYIPPAELLGHDLPAAELRHWVKNLTERRQAEEQRQRYAAELEERNEEVKQFAYIVSHDLRAPLINLMGFAAELQSALGVLGPAVNIALPHLDEKQRQAALTALQEDIPEALDFIDSSVTRMDRFIHAVLQLSRLGYREIKLEMVAMEPLVQEILKSLAHQMGKRQVKVTVGSLPEVVADRTSMEQIMGNLLTNAVNYLAPGRLGEIEITAERGPDETTFHVRDNGRGIAAEEMDKVFAPFRRAGPQEVPGEGMGLAYAQTLVRRHGGRIWCESEPGVGTTFTFTLSNHLAGGGNHV